MSLSNSPILSAATIRPIHVFSSAFSAFLSANILRARVWRSCNPGPTLRVSVTAGTVTQHHRSSLCNPHRYPHTQKWLLPLRRQISKLKPVSLWQVLWSLWLQIMRVHQVPSFHSTMIIRSQIPMTNCPCSTPSLTRHVTSRASSHDTNTNLTSQQYIIYLIMWHVTLQLSDLFS